MVAVLVVGREGCRGQWWQKREEGWGDGDRADRRVQSVVLTGGATWAPTSAFLPALLSQVFPHLFTSPPPSSPTSALDFFGGLTWSAPKKKKKRNGRNITLMEPKWALFLKSFFEISEAIPWPRDHILFTFPLPATQATPAKFTKEDPHWKIRLIPDWKFMCWLRWISSGRFSQERGVKEKKRGKKEGGKKKRQQKWDPFWLESGLSVSGRQAKLMSACQELPFMLEAAAASLFSAWRGRFVFSSSEEVGVSRSLQRSSSRKDATSVYLVPLYSSLPLHPLLPPLLVHSFLSHVLQSVFPLSFLPSFPGCLSLLSLSLPLSLSSRGGGYG